MFVLVVDDFGVENFGKKHVAYLMTMLEEHYDITADPKG